MAFTFYARKLFHGYFVVVAALAHRDVDVSLSQRDD